MKARKIVVIGAGSAEFGSQSLYGIMQTEGLHGFELEPVALVGDAQEPRSAVGHRAVDDLCSRTR